MATSDGIVHCEVCRLPHRRDAKLCDGCRHPLGAAPDWSALRRELPLLKLQMLLGGIMVVAMIVASIVALSRGGYFIALAPIAWVIFAATRHRMLSNRLRAAKQPP